MKKVQSILLIVVATLLFNNVKAQGDCSIVLREAQDTYDAGNLDAVLEMIYPCLESGFNKNEKIQAYKLIALTFPSTNRRAFYLYYKYLHNNKSFRFL